MRGLCSWMGGGSGVLCVRMVLARCRIRFS